MRKVQSLLILAVFLLIFGGCHSKREPDSALQSREVVSAGAMAAEESAAEADDRADKADTANDGRPVIVCFGDSLTAGYGAPSDQSYPDYLQADLDRLGYHYRVENEGVSGNTTKDGVERLPEVLALHPAIAVVEFGGNDGLRGLPISESRMNLDEIVKRLKAAGAQVVITGITLPPNYGPDYVRQFDDSYVVLAKKYRTPMLPFLLKNVYGVPGMMQQDNIHATGKGNKVVAKNVLKLIHPLLKK